MKKVFLEISQNSQETPVPESLFHKVAGDNHNLKQPLFAYLNINSLTNKLIDLKEIVSRLSRTFRKEIRR